MKRIVLFLATNLAIIVLLGIVLRLLGIAISAAATTACLNTSSARAITAAPL